MQQYSSWSGFFEVLLPSRTLGMVPTRVLKDESVLRRAFEKAHSEAAQKVETAL